ncbi:MAG: hypothetical protein GWP91_02545 [Rhodobacterales bacterium]|nr:hypothetical protein [Rhodobacterales bacterium]
MRIDVPGKIVLMGEYAVLDGAPAIVAAVDRGVRCTFSANDSRMTLRVPQDDRFVSPALAAVNAPTGQYDFQPWNQPKTSTKAGFGGSAAATVAAVMVGRLAQGEEHDANLVQQIATRVHRAVQGGGSGIDVAASAHGGVLRFQNGDVEQLPSIHPVVVWSGSSAQTGPRVQQYLAWTERAHFVRDTNTAVESFGADPILAMAEMTKLLDHMSQLAGIDYWTPALFAISTLAKKLGGAAKPSGAGGGDIAVALLPSSLERAHFVRDIEAAGLQIIPVNLCDGPTFHPSDGADHA